MRKSAGSPSDPIGIRTTSAEESPMPNIRIPGSNEETKEKPKKSLIQELKPEGEIRCRS